MVNPLHDYIESLPLARFPDAFSPDDFMEHVAALFAPNPVSMEPTIHCSENGNWVSGSSVVVALPEQGVHACFVEFDFDPDSPSVYGRGNFIDVVTGNLRSGHVWSSDSLLGLYVRLAETITRQEILLDWDRHGMLNDKPEVWALRHVRGLLSPSDLAAAETLVGLSTHNPRDLKTLLDCASNVANNQHGAEDASHLVADTTERFYGIRPDSYQVERSGIVGALMVLPRNEWPVEAERLVGVTALRERFGPEFKDAVERSKRRLQVRKRPDQAGTEAAPWFLAV